MESKKFCLGEHFTSYDDIKEKLKKYEEENFVNVWIRDSRSIEAAGVKKNYNVNMGEGSLKVKVLERGHRHKSFFQRFYNCL